MAETDRAFRALARSEPDVVLALLRAVLPELVSAPEIGADCVEDPKFDLPPPIEADLVARHGEQGILHVEGQGYREPGFELRVFRYHLALVLRHPGRRIRSVAVWFERPPRRQRNLQRIEHSGVTAEVETVVLAEVPASLLLRHPMTACFLPGADPEGRSDLELCRLATRALTEHRGGWQRQVLCAAVALAAGRYDAMVQAMEEAGLEIPVIEDFVRFGVERGEARGLKKGERRLLRKQLVLKFGELPEHVDARLDEATEEQLERWAERILTATSIDDTLL